MLAHCCVNGASEMVTNLSMGITTFLFNMAMLHYLGENGVAAITIVLYAQFLMVSIFLGFTSGVAPVISFHYGAQNWEQERRIIRYCYTFLIACSIITLALSISLCAIPDGHLFTGGHGGIRFGAAWLLSFRGKLFAGWDQHLCLRHVHGVFQRTDLRTFIPAAHTCVRCVGHCTPALFPGVGRCVADNSRRGAWRDHFLLVFYLEIPQSVWLRGRGGTLEEGRGSAIVTGGLTAHIGQRNKDKKPDGTTDILFLHPAFIAVIIPPAPW